MKNRQPIVKINETKAHFFNCKIYHTTKVHTHKTYSAMIYQSEHLLNTI